jgi:hypothetical protein
MNDWELAGQAWVDDLLDSARNGTYHAIPKPFILAAIEYFLNDETAEWAKEINDQVFPLMVEVIDE